MSGRGSEQPPQMGRRVRCESEKRLGDQAGLNIGLDMAKLGLKIIAVEAEHACPRR